MIADLDLDFPAAHSMDTAWFAVDDDGHVAVFDTGEAGAVPTLAYVGEAHHDWLEALQARGAQIYDLAGHQSPDVVTSNLV